MNGVNARLNEKFLSLVYPKYMKRKMLQNCTAVPSRVMSFETKRDYCTFDWLHVRVSLPVEALHEIWWEWDRSDGDPFISVSGPTAALQTLQHKAANTAKLLYLSEYRKTEPTVKCGVRITPSADDCRLKRKTALT